MTRPGNTGLGITLGVGSSGWATWGKQNGKLAAPFIHQVEGDIDGAYGFWPERLSLPVVDDDEGYILGPRRLIGTLKNAGGSFGIGSFDVEVSVAYGSSGFAQAQSVNGHR